MSDSDDNYEEGERESSVTDLMTAMREIEIRDSDGIEIDTDDFIDSDESAFEEILDDHESSDDGEDLSSLSEVDVERFMTLKSLLMEYKYAKRLLYGMMCRTNFTSQTYWLLGRKRDLKSELHKFYNPENGDLSQRLAAIDLESLKEKLNAITTRATKVCNRKGIAVKKGQHSFSRSDQEGGSTSFEGSNTFERPEEKDVVGFKEDIDKLLRMLHDNGKDGHLEIVSIVGAAGGGKTTLAKEVYEHRLTSHAFAFRAWVTVSQQYDKTMKKNLLICILESAYPGAQLECYEKYSEDELGERTLKILKGKKYLIVMDDVWSTEALEDIQRSLPRERHGSKVLFTSRLPVQPNSVNCIDPHHLAALPKDCSWELLRMKVFGQKCCPPELVSIGEHIAEKCQGLPLAIVAIAGILVTKDKKLDVWEEVSKDLSSTIAKNQVSYMKILEFSYNYLPPHLKDCFVYIGGFPEDSEILERELIWLWIAEGFIQQTEGGKSLEDVAKGYLSNLISRNLIMVARKGCFGGIKACRIHDLLRELCLKKAEENNFLMQVYKEDTFSPNDNFKHHRLFVGIEDFDNIFFRFFTQNLRSFLHLKVVRHSDGSTSKTDLSFIDKNFELLKVLSVMSVESKGEIGRGVHLRYLALLVPVDILQFRLPFSYLLNLETINLHSRFTKARHQAILLPRDIFKMVKLRHLYAERGVFQYHYCIDSSSELDSLQTLHQICPCKDCRKFLERTPNLRKLEICCAPRFEFENDGMYFNVNPDLEFLECLETLVIEDCSMTGRCLETLVIEDCSMTDYGVRPKLKFPPTLKRLTLRRTSLEWDQLSTLQTLPSLEVLKLVLDACKGTVWNTSQNEGFSQLKYLRLEEMEIKEWNATEEDFPKLEVLVINGCKKLKQIPDSFVSLYELRKIEVTWSCGSAEESARKIQEERGDGITLLAEDNIF